MLFTQKKLIKKRVSMNNIVSIFGKGGVGKSTTAFLLVDFFSRMSGFKVLVIDLDKQNTISSTLLSRKKIEQEKKTSKCFNCYIENAVNTQCYDVSAYVHAVKNTNIQVMFVDGEKTEKIEDDLLSNNTLSVAKSLKKELISRYDIVIIDTPPNIDKRNKIPVIGHFLSDLIIIPVELTDFNIDALYGVFDTIKMMRKKSGNRLELKSGILLNKIYRNNQCENKTKRVNDLSNDNDSFVFSETLPLSSILNIQPLEGNKISIKKRYGRIYNRIHRFIMEIPRRIPKKASKEKPFQIPSKKKNIHIKKQQTEEVDASYIESYLTGKCHSCGKPAISGDNVCYMHSR